MATSSDGLNQLATGNHSQEIFRDFMAGATFFEDSLPAVSIFSGVGLGDYGFRRAGFAFRVHSELCPARARTIQMNHHESKVVVGDVRTKTGELLDAYRTQEAARPSLVTITPPCAGLSPAGQWKTGSPLWAEPSTDSRNALALAAAEVVRELQPAHVFLECVPGFKTRPIVDPATGRTAPPFELFCSALGKYSVAVDIVQMADHGVPQRRQRLVAIFTRDDLVRARLPEPTHSRDRSSGKPSWPRARDTLRGYKSLDGGSPSQARDPTDELHVVPSYTELQYSWVSRIPKHSGMSAYDVSKCDRCGRADVPRSSVRCPSCRAVLLCRPRIYLRKGLPRLIKGNDTSYRRMPSDLPVPTIMTNNGHYGGDTKIHPWQNRVLSVREVLDHQTVPRDFQWPTFRGKPMVTLIREGAGESVPPWFTFRVGLAIQEALARSRDERDRMALGSITS